MTVSVGNEEDVKVRLFQPQDEERCLQLFSDNLLSYRDPPLDKLQPMFVNMKLKEDMADIHANYIDKPRSNFWVAQHSGRVVGCVAATPDEGREKSMELLRMSVDQSYRRRGVASLMLQQVEEFARAEGFHELSLRTLVLMTPACAFYEKNGFKKDGITRVKFGEIEAVIQRYAKEL